MTVYYRPLVQSDCAKPSAAVPLCDGPLWFTQVERLERGQEPQLVEISDIPKEILQRLTARRKSICDLTMDVPRIMGILNATPDSFSDGGLYYTFDQASAHAREMIANGADIIDIGGESTRPGATYVSPMEEVSRTVPVITSLGDIATPISIDTRKASVADAAIMAGASIFNDVSALTFDPDSLAVAAKYKIPVCLMHAVGGPETMQDNPRYDDVLLDVYDYLQGRVEACEAVGFERSSIIVDPGIGFGKTLEHNLALIRGLSLFHGLGCPILLGASRKKFIGVLGNAEDAADRVAGSVAVALEGARQGVQILRVHDIAETRQALNLWQAI